MTPLAVVLGFIALQRLAELVLAARNARALRAAGGREVGARHYPLFIALHGLWWAAMALTIPAAAPVNLALFGVFVVLQGVRVWVIASLGRRWTTRVIVVPEAPLVRRGPYRWLRHPNYLVVAAEIAVVPAMFGAWGLALAFSVLNAALLAHRIRVEDRALGRA